MSGRHTSHIPEERLERCRGTMTSNCIGTALFLSGARRKDSPLYNYEHMPRESPASVLRGLMRIDSPEHGCIAAWVHEDGSSKIHVRHMGVVMSVDPLMVAHRTSYHGIFVEGESIDTAGRGFGACSIEYYVPVSRALY